MGLFKSIKKAVKSVGKEIGRAGKKIDKEVRRNPGGWVGTLGTMGMNVTAKNVASGVQNLLVPEMPGLPAIPDPPKYGQVQQSTQQAPTVDLYSTESRRRTSGVAKGSRKLKVPLGGI